MERIKLSKAGKTILKELKRGHTGIPDGMDNYTFYDAVVDLRDKKLVKAITEYETLVSGLCLTAKGYSYIRNNPMLLNPVNWTKVAAISASIAAIAGILGLFIGCALISR